MAGSASRPGVAIAGEGLSREGLEDGRLPEGRPVGDRGLCWSGSLKLTEKHRL